MIPKVLRAAARCSRVPESASEENPLLKGRVVLLEVKLLVNLCCSFLLSNITSNVPQLISKPWPQMSWNSACGEARLCLVG
uniref:Uncharacterized protein n=1 Tax=Ascaris lumbricoides TaxID=6252 RepID=A0A0M3I9I1_ASCLU